MLKAEEKYDQLSDTDKQQYEVLKNAISRIELGLNKKFGMPPESISTSFEQSHQITINVLKRKLDWGQTLLDEYHSVSGEKRRKVNLEQKQEEASNQDSEEPQPKKTRRKRKSNLTAYKKQSYRARSLKRI